MKKFNAFELIGIGVSIYLVCLIFGAISKHILSFDVDVLSASATLFAAVVALLLFNSWKDEHVINQLLNMHTSLKEKYDESHKSYLEIPQKVQEINGSFVKKGYEIAIDVSLVRSKLQKDLSDLLALLLEYEIFLENLKQSELLLKHLVKIKEVHAGISETLEILNSVDKAQNLDSLVSLTYSIYLDMSVFLSFTNHGHVIKNEITVFYSKYLKEI